MQMRIRNYSRKLGNAETGKSRDLSADCRLLVGLVFAPRLRFAKEVSVKEATRFVSFLFLSLHAPLNSTAMASKLGGDSKIDSMLMKLPDETGKGGELQTISYSFV